MKKQLFFIIALFVAQTILSADSPFSSPIEMIDGWPSPKDFRMDGRICPSQSCTPSQSPVPTCPANTPTNVATQHKIISIYHLSINTDLDERSTTKTPIPFRVTVPEIPPKIKPHSRWCC